MTQPVVVKFGTGLVVEDEKVRTDLLHARAREIAQLVGAGDPVCVVSSGAIALGLARLGLKQRPRTIARRRPPRHSGRPACRPRGKRRSGTRASRPPSPAGRRRRRRPSGLRECAPGVHELFRLGAVPVVNENDATATDEITFGDNDALAAQVAVLVSRTPARSPDRGRRRLFEGAGDPRCGVDLRGRARPRGRDRRRHSARARRDGQQGGRRPDGVPRPASRP